MPDAFPSDLRNTFFKLERNGFQMLAGRVKSRQERN